MGLAAWLLVARGGGSAQGAAGIASVAAPQSAEPPASSSSVPTPPSASVDASAVGQGPAPSCRETRAAVARGLGLADGDEAGIAGVRALVDGVLEGRSTERASCYPGLLDDVVAAKGCGLAFQRIADALTREAAIDPGALGRAIGRRSECRRMLVEKTTFAGDVSVELVREVHRLTTDTDVDGETQRTAWYTYGALADTARKHGKVGIVSEVERSLARELGATKDAEHVQTLLRSAGNAGCHACVARVRPYLRSKDARFRRGALLALRLVEAQETVGSLCAALRADADVEVRTVAAMSLRATNHRVKERVECLVLAALEDDDSGVARQALISLSALANESDYALGGLLAISRNAEERDVRERAATLLSEHPRAPKTKRAGKGE